MILAPIWKQSRSGIIYIRLKTYTGVLTTIEQKLDDFERE